MNYKGKDFIEPIAEKTLYQIDKYNLDAELNLRYNQSATSRFANSQIIQNMEETAISITLRIAMGKKVTAGFTNDISDEGIRIFVNNLIKTLKLSPDIPFFEGFVDFDQNRQIPIIDVTTKSWNTEDRASTIASVISTAENLQKNIKMAGTCTSIESSRMFLSSNGRKFASNFTSNYFKVNAILEKNHDRGFGQKELFWRKSKPEFTRLTEEVINIAKATTKPEVNPPGEFKVVLSPQAVAELLYFIQFNLEASAFHEGRCFASDLLRKQIFDEKLDLVDNPLDSTTSHLTFPFDLEGVPKNKRKLINHGTVEFIPYSSFKASQYLKNKNLFTGHFAGEGFSACTSIVQSSENSDELDLIQDTQNGLFINELWYTRYTDPKNGGLTGLTRNGLFSIRNGELGPAVNNLRYTDTFLSIFGPENIIGLANNYTMNNFSTTVSMALEKIKFSSKANSI